MALNFTEEKSQVCRFKPVHPLTCSILFTRILLPSFGAKTWNLNKKFVTIKKLGIEKSKILSACRVVLTRWLFTTFFHYLFCTWRFEIFFALLFWGSWMFVGFKSSVSCLRRRLDTLKSLASFHFFFLYSGCYRLHSAAKIQLVQTIGKNYRYSEKIIEGGRK